MELQAQKCVLNGTGLLKKVIIITIFLCFSRPKQTSSLPHHPGLKTLFQVFISPHSSNDTNNSKLLMLTQLTQPKNKCNQADRGWRHEKTFSTQEQAVPGFSKYQ